MMMRWWLFGVTRRETWEVGWHSHGVSLARRESMQPDDLGCRGSVLSGLWPFQACVRSPLSSSLDLAGSDSGDQPPGALPGPLMRESGTHGQPRSRMVSQQAALVSGLGGVLLAWTSSLCPPLVGASASFGVTRPAPDPVVRWGDRDVYWPVSNDASGPAARPCTAGWGLPG